MLDSQKDKNVSQFVIFLTNEIVIVASDFLLFKGVRVRVRTGPFRLIIDTPHFHGNFNFTESKLETVPGSLNYSCRTTVNSQGISLP